MGSEGQRWERIKHPLGVAVERELRVRLGNKTKHQKREAWEVELTERWR